MPIIFGVAVVGVVLLLAQSTLQGWHEDNLMYACRSQAIAANYSAADVAKMCNGPQSKFDLLDLKVGATSAPKNAPAASAPRLR